MANLANSKHVSNIPGPKIESGMLDLNSLFKCTQDDLVRTGFRTGPSQSFKKVEADTKALLSPEEFIKFLKSMDPAKRDALPLHIM